MEAGSPFSPEQKGALFTFLSRQVSKYDTEIVVDRRMFEQVLEFLTNIDDDANMHDRQLVCIVCIVSVVCIVLCKCVNIVRRY